MKIKKIVALILVLLIAVPISGVLSGSSQINNSSQFYNWLLDSGTPVFSISGTYQANYNVYKDYGLIVYGGPSYVPRNEYKEGEYRYLGYTFLESKYTNQEFPNDAVYSNIPENWDFVEISGAVESWESLEQSIQKPYMLYTKLSGHGATTLKASDIGIIKTRVQSPATWMNIGSIYTYKSNDYYATFTVPSMGLGILSANMSSDEENVEVPIGTNSEQTNLRVNASINKAVAEVSWMKVVFHFPYGDKTRFFHNTNTISISQTYTMNIPANLPAVDNITATVTAESIFGDKLKNEVSCSINIIGGSGNSSGPSSPPSSETPSPTNTSVPTATPNPTATPEPSESPEPNIYSPLDSVELWGDWNYWDDEPHRFLALEKIHVRVWFRGYVKRIVVRLSEPLEQMQYTNSDGYTYDYCNDFFGYYVDFPRDSTIYISSSSKKLRYVEKSYILPLCDETISWSDDRLADSYSITIEIYGSGSDIQVYCIDDVDITGNTYELLHPQPVK